jgi:hypothetical protein
MSKTKRRIEINIFRRRRIAITSANPEAPPEPSTTDIDESLVTEILALVNRLTGDPPGNAMGNVGQETDDKHPMRGSGRIIRSDKPAIR